MNHFIQIFKKDLKVNTGFFNKLAVFTYRFGNAIYYNVRIPLIRHLLLFFYKILDILILKVLFQAEIPKQCKIGPGISLPHGANGIIMHPDVSIGSNVTIFHQVTLGINPIELGKSLKAPRVGNDVFIGAGVKIIGDLKIGDGAKIGANAVVVKDIPTLKTAVGIPAKVVSR